jgi:hypothetical protein
LNGASGADVFPQVPWISVALKRMAQLSEERQELYKQVSPFRIRGHRGYGRLSSTQYENAIKSLQDEHNEKRAKAQNATPEVVKS